MNGASADPADGEKRVHHVLELFGYGHCIPAHELDECSSRRSLDLRESIASARGPAFRSFLAGRYGRVKTQLPLADVVEPQYRAARLATVDRDGPVIGCDSVRFDEVIG